MNHFIFFHGVGIRSPFWNSIVPILEEKSLNYSLIDLDFSSLDNAFQSSKDSVRDIIKKYPDRNIVIVGHSLGGLFATYVAQLLGEEVHKLIIVSTGLAPKRVAMKAVQQKQRNYIYKLFKKLGMRMLFGGHLPKWMTRSMFFTRHTTKETQQELSKHKIREKKNFLIEHFNSKKIWNEHFSRVHFSGPDNVLCICGDKDRTTPMRAFLYLKDHLNASHKVYKGCGHNDIVTAEKFNKRFIDDIILFSSI